jgi:hypothetical protein
MASTTPWLVPLFVLWFTRKLRLRSACLYIRWFATQAMNPSGGGLSGTTLTGAVVLSSDLEIPKESGIYQDSNGKVPAMICGCGSVKSVSGWESHR